MPAAVNLNEPEAMQMVEAGYTNKEIAAHFGCAENTIVNRLEAFDASAYARARLISAEAYLDRGMETLREAARKDSEYEPQIARAIAQEYARRAALRNPAYREKQDHNHSGSLTLNVASELAALNARSPD